MVNKWVKPLIINRIVIYAVFKKQCKFGNFGENVILANGFKRHICGVKNSRQGMIYYISKQQSEFAILQGFNFHKTSHMHIAQGHNTVKLERLEPAAPQSVTVRIQGVYQWCSFF